MLPLYIRGLGLGLLFSPLSAISLMDIPRQKMGQASGLFNTIRQIGGSFGVALLGTLLTRRVIYHTSVYGQSVDTNSPVYKHIISNVQNFAISATGGTAQQAALKAKALILSNTSSQAFIQGINDDFLLGALITLVLLVPLFFLKTSKDKPLEKIEIME